MSHPERGRGTYGFTVLEPEEDICRVDVESSLEDGSSSVGRWVERSA